MLALQRLTHTDADFDQQLQGLFACNQWLDPEITKTVTTILKDVQERGDVALLDYTRRLDQRKVTIDDIRISAEAMAEAADKIPAELRAALQQANDRVSAYHEHQRQQSWRYEDADGSVLGQQMMAMDKVGIYVPGGKAAYPSSVIMNTVPARVAGVDEVVMVVPARQGELNPVVLAAAHIAGVDYGFSIGGAQAVAALAFGTATVPAVDKIVGPGNHYVATAKRLVFGMVGIDMIAGPSEVVIIADASADPDWLAMDLLAQAEHDEDARAILISTDAAIIDNVQQCIDQRLVTMPRRAVIVASLENNGALIQVADLEMAAQVANQIAPEHLQLAVADPDRLAGNIRHAGAMFLGHYAAEVLGDYCAGPNHVLPTGRTARFSSPLGVYDFQKRTSLIKCSKSSASRLAGTAVLVARAEGLFAHAGAAALRITKD